MIPNYCVIHSHSDCDALQSDIISLMLWACSWQLIFHPNKCMVSRIGKGHPPYIYCLPYLSGRRQPLKEVDSEKDLGVIIDRNLDFNQQCQASTNWAKQILGIIRRSTNHLDRQMFVTLYQSLVRPLLEASTRICHSCLVPRD